MNKTNIVFLILLLAGFGYYAYDVFLAEDALVKRAQSTKDANGGYKIVTQLKDGAQVIETYEVHLDGSPKSHDIYRLGPEPGSERQKIKQSTFVPKF